MINSKVSAFIRKEDEWVKISRWDLLRLSEVDYRKFMDTTRLYLRKTEDSPELTFNRHQKTFRFLPNQNENRERNSSGLTISHILVQEVLAELQTLNFVLFDKRTKANQKIELKVNVNNSIIEQPLFDGKYIADLLILFSDPLETAKNWNKRFVLEVFASNQVRGQKIIMFEENGYALIEIRIGEKLKTKKKITEITQKEEDELKRYISNSFKKQIYGDLLVSPISDEIIENKAINEKNINIEELKSEIINLKSHISLVEKETIKLKQTKDLLSSELEYYKNLLEIEKKRNIKNIEKQNELEEKIKKLEHPSFLSKLKLIFK